MGGHNVQSILDLIEIDASRLEGNANYGGAMNDGGAGRLREQVEVYKAGMAGEIPKDWQKYATYVKLNGMPCPVCTVNGVVSTLTASVGSVRYSCKRGHTLVIEGNKNEA